MFHLAKSSRGFTSSSRKKSIKRNFILFWFHNNKGSLSMFSLDNYEITHLTNIFMSARLISVHQKIV